VDFLFGDNELAAVFSRGESKLFLCLLLLAQASVMAQVLAEPPVLLVDDFGAELDRAAQERLLSLLAGCGAQVFLTSAATELPGPLPKGARRFHVEHGKFREMVE
jgi:DNA replication and repair protein RecF